MRRTELLIESIKRQAESQIDSTGGGISDEEILDHLNAGQYGLYSEIVQAVPDILLVDSFVDLVANQEEYELPSDVHLGTSLKSVWYKYGIGTSEYTKIPSNVDYYRSSDIYSDGPAFYIRKGSTILINPIPITSVTSGLRLTYQQRVRRLDIRRGVISSLSKTGDVLNTLTIDLTPTLGKDQGSILAARNLLNKTDKICIVNKAGRSILNNIPIDSYDSSTGILTIGTTDDNEDYETDLTGPDLIGHYIVVGDYSTTHGDFPDETIERYLLAYATMCLLRRQGNPEETQFKLQEVQAIKGDIINAYEDPDQDVKLMVPDITWTGAHPYRGSMMGGGGGGSAASTSIDGDNVGLAGEGLFKQASGSTLQFFNIDVDSGLDVTTDVINDTVDISLDINELTADASPTSSDYLLEYDVSAGNHKKTLIGSLPFPVVPVDPNADRILFWDDSVGSFQYLTPDSSLSIVGTTLDVVEANIDHNSLQNFVANKHIDHTSVTLTAGEGLTGGGDISASRSFALDYSDLSTTDTLVGASDLVSIHDGAQKKITFADYTASTDHNLLLNYVANQHIDWTAASSAFSTTGTGAVTDVLLVRGNATQGGRIRLAEDTDNGTNYMEIRANPTMASDFVLTLPADDGTASQALTTDGSGLLSWTTITAAAGGSNTQIQYNNSSALGGDSGFTTNGAGAVNIVGDLDVDNININGNDITSTDANGNINLRPNGSGVVQLTGNSTQAGELRLYEDTDNGSNYAAIKVPASLGGNYTLTLPVDDGTSDQLLKTDGSGVLSWTSVSGSSVVVQQIRATTNTSGSTTTVIPDDDTIPQNTEGAEVITVSITPTNTNSILVIEYNFFGMIDQGATPRAGSSALFQDTTANALYAQIDIKNAASGGDITSSVFGKHTMTAGTTSATTFKLRIGPANADATYYWLRNVGGDQFSTVALAQLTVTEYTA